MSDSYTEIAERFQRFTAQHEMTVLHDDGLYRHLRFTSNPRGYGEYWHDLVTAPYTLIFKGDGEAFVFTIDATPDMFSLFRKTSHHGGINPGYWSEKLASRRDVARVYSQELFEKEVAEALAAAEDAYPGVSAAWAEHVEAEFNTEYEGEARRALDEFRFGESYRAACSKCDWALEDDSWVVARRRLTEHTAEAGKQHAGAVRDLTFTFCDTWEWQLQDFDRWFLWACHAIVAGIARYDASRTAVAA